MLRISLLMHMPSSNTCEICRSFLRVLLLSFVYFYFFYLFHFCLSIYFASLSFAYLSLSLSLPFTRRPSFWFPRISWWDYNFVIIFLQFYILTTPSLLFIVFHSCFCYCHLLLFFLFYDITYLFVCKSYSNMNTSIDT